MIELSRGRPVVDLAAIAADLDASRAGEGYGRFVLGMIAHYRGERERARPLLLEFVSRNSNDPLKVATLAGELERARQALQSTRTPR